MNKNKEIDYLQDVTATSQDKNSRIDKFLSVKFNKFSRSRIQSLILEGNVFENSNIILDPNYKVKEGLKYIIRVPEASNEIPQGQKIALEIVFEDNELIVIDKPPGLVTHPAPGNADNTLVNALIAHCGNSLSGIGGVRRPGIVHRLDKDTSGLIVVAKNDRSHVALANQFNKHTIERKYLALVWGRPKSTSGIIEKNIGRHPISRKKMSVLENTKGKKAITEYKVIKSLNTSISELECQLKTGRTHQIRVHMSYLGHPIIGDSLYGKKNRLLKLTKKISLDPDSLISRQALHAKHLGFIHPKTSKKMTFDSKIPNDINNIIKFFANP